jgi:hypothetical protein
MSDQVSTTMKKSINRTNPRRANYQPQNYKKQKLKFFLKNIYILKCWGWLQYKSHIANEEEKKKSRKLYLRNSSFREVNGEGARWYI